MIHPAAISCRVAAGAPWAPRDRERLWPSMPPIQTDEGEGPRYSAEARMSSRGEPLRRLWLDGCMRQSEHREMHRPWRPCAS